MSLSLALGILVRDLSGYKLLTEGAAQQGSCAGKSGGPTVVVGSVVLINNGVAEAASSSAT